MTKKTLTVVSDRWSQGYQTLTCAASPPIAGEAIVEVCSWRDANGMSRTAVLDATGKFLAASVGGSRAHDAAAEAAGYRIRY